MGTINWAAPDNGSGAWSTPSNWAGGAVPSGTADVRFAGAFDLLDPEVHIELDALTQARSLWFGAGRWYNLEDDGSGNGSLELGHGFTGWDNLVVVSSIWGSGPQSENNIELPISIVSDGAIINQSEGGLRFGRDIILENENLRIGGYGATHFAGELSGESDIGVGGNASDVQPHFVLSMDNVSWSGDLEVNNDGFAIAKAYNALGSGAISVNSGGTLGFRRDSWSAGMPYSPLGNAIAASGKGIIRRNGHDPVGAIYSDGGTHWVDIPINFSGETWFGARGDRIGGGFGSPGLYLDGDVQGAPGASFVKVETGLVVLGFGNYSWDGPTIIRDGVLRLDPGMPPNTSNVQFDGTNVGFNGAWPRRPVLEVTSLGSNFQRYLGEGADQIQWRGSGGFSTSDDMAFITLNDGAQLTWGEDYFVPDGSALLFGSRFANGVTQFVNAIDLGSGQREIYAERGGDYSQTRMSGDLSGTGGITKTGRGLLALWGSNNSYSGATRIEGGALGKYIPSASNIVFDGGVLGLDDHFSRNIGTGAGEFQWLGHGGFAAYGGSYYGDDMNVSLNSGALLTWGAGGGIDANHELRFGHYTANGTVMWQNQISITGGDRTIRLERGMSWDRADVVFTTSDSLAMANGTLNIFGNGRMDISAASSALSAGLDIRGAELRLNKGSHIPNVPTIRLSRGGTLTLDNWGTHKSSSGGSTLADRIGDTTSITFNAGALSLWYDGAVGPPSEKVGALIFQSGGNSIRFDNNNNTEPNQLGAASILRTGASNRSTLYLSKGAGGHAELKLDTSSSGINGGGGTAILPWGYSDAGWMAPVNDSGTDYLRPTLTFYIGAESGWSSAENVRINVAYTLGDNRTVNSLTLYGNNSSNLNMNGKALTIYSGGLAIRNSKHIIDNGTITTAENRPLYIHTLNQLTLSGNARFTGGMDLVKAGADDHALTLNGSGTHQIGNLYIHNGTVDLQLGQLNARRIYVGDGAGTDIFKLPGNRREALRGSSGAIGAASITLHGTPYDPRGPDYGGDQAILRMGGNTKQSLAHLHIEERGTIDWAGGEVGRANYLWLDSLTFSSADAQLFMRNWYEYEDFLLVRKSGFDAGYLSQIIFEGYENYSTTYRRYDNDYWQITPFGKDVSNLNVPEPTTYGAILAAAGVGLVLYRKRQQRRRTRHAASAIYLAEEA